MNNKSVSYKIHASSIIEPPASLSCPKCGTEVTSNYCQMCGFKVK